MHNPLDYLMIGELEILKEQLNTGFAQMIHNKELVTGLPEEDRNKYMRLASEACTFYNESLVLKEGQIRIKDYHKDLEHNVGIEIKFRK